MTIGVIIDLVAKKRNYKYELEEGLKNEREKRY
jgi:hypothetical protein